MEIVELRKNILVCYDKTIRQEKEGACLKNACPDKEGKTNAMRLLDQAGVDYQTHCYPHGKEAVDGETVAKLLGQDPQMVFKTLVARGKSGALFVFVIPVAETLDLKKAARAAGEKAVTLVAVREIVGLTGYVRGGCSPVGMKRAYPTFFHKSALDQSRMMVSAGKIGWQIETDPLELITLVQGQTADLIL